MFSVNFDPSLLRRRRLNFVNISSKFHACRLSLLVNDRKSRRQTLSVGDDGTLREKARETLLYISVVWRIGAA